jgi:tellurite resistance protein TehA-like permease
MLEKYTWLGFVALAGLAWGTYVPFIFYGGNELGGKAASRILAILCVGIAYMVIAVLFPLVYLYLMTPAEQRPEMNPNGLFFSGLAGAAGAIGAICVIFASKSATQTALAAKLNPAHYRLYIGPLIFGLAPVINTLVSLIWHPHKGEPFHFGFDIPGWKLWVGIILVGLGAALVLFSKEEVETGKHAVKPQPQTIAAASAPQAKPEAAP